MTKIYTKLKQHDPLITPSGNIWIGGFPRSGNTFASSFIEHFTICEYVEKHIHSPAQVMRFVKSGDPGGVVLRNPTSACISLSIFSGIEINRSIQNYIDFHDVLLESGMEINWIDFDHLIKDPLHLITMFGLEEKCKNHKIQHFLESPNEALKEVYDRIDRHWATKPPDIFLRQTARPTTVREGLKTELEQAIFQNPFNKQCWETANEMYCNILSRIKMKQSYYK